MSQRKHFFVVIFPYRNQLLMLSPMQCISRLITTTQDASWLHLDHFVCTGGFAIPWLDPPSLSVVHQNLLAIHSTSPLSFRIFNVGDIGTGPRLFDNRQEAFYDNADLMEVWLVGGAGEDQIWEAIVEDEGRRVLGVRSHTILQTVH